MPTLRKALLIVLALCSGPLFGQCLPWPCHPWPVGPPPFPFTPSGGQALVHAGGWTGTIASSTLSQAFGFTTTAGDFIYVVPYVQGGTVTSVSVSGTTITSDATGFYPLPNAPAASQVTVNCSGCNGSLAQIVVLEFSGVSSTAAGQGTEAVGANNFEIMDSYSSSAAYTNPTAGSLVIGVWQYYSTQSAVTSMSGSGAWVTGANALAPGASCIGIFVEYQLNAAAGSYTSAGTSLPTGNYSHMVPTTFGYK